jgi:hypothetical protein
MEMIRWSWRSLISARGWMSPGNFREYSPWKTLEVSLQVKFSITCGEALPNLVIAARRKSAKTGGGRPTHSHECAYRVAAKALTSLSAIQPCSPGSA